MCVYNVHIQSNNYVQLFPVHFRNQYAPRNIHLALVVVSCKAGAIVVCTVLFQLFGWGTITPRPGYEMKKTTKYSPEYTDAWSVMVDSIIRSSVSTF